jgi:hypothetical protein
MKRKLNFTLFPKLASALLLLILALSLMPRTHKGAIKKGPTPTPTSTPQKETLWHWLLRVSGISATSAGQKGEDYRGAGNIYVADRLRLGETDAKALTSDGGYRWPLFMPCEQAVLALQGDKLVKIAFPQQGSQTSVQSQTLFEFKGIIKLIGFVPEDTESVAVLLNEQNSGSPVGLLSLKTHKLTPLPYDPKADEPLMTQIQNSLRTYGDTLLYVKADPDTKSTDVYIHELGNDQDKNLSLCAGLNCGEPALSTEGRYVVFVRAKA